MLPENEILSKFYIKRERERKKKSLKNFIVVYFI